MTAPLAALSPANDQPSIRQDWLTQDARDVLAWAFREGFPVSDVVPFPMTAVELRIGITDDLERLLFGGGIVRHGGSDSARYFKHADDPAWAVVFAHDCDGDPERGERIVQAMQEGKAA